MKTTKKTPATQAVTFENVMSLVNVKHDENYSCSHNADLNLCLKKRIANSLIV